MPGCGGQLLEIGCVVHHPDWEGVLCNLRGGGGGGGVSRLSYINCVPCVTVHLRGGGGGGCYVTWTQLGAWKVETT